MYPHAGFRRLVSPEPLSSKRTLGGLRSRVEGLRRWGVALPDDIAMWSHDALDALVAFADGRALVGRRFGRALVWVLVGARGATLRTFPAGARAVRDAAGIVVVETAQGSVRLGK